MARQVYADPFGSYVGGYELGAARQQSLEKDIRSARREDAFFPLDFAGAQRRDKFEQFGDPYARNAVVRADRSGRNNLFDQDASLASKYPGQMLGVTAPLENTVLSHYNMTRQDTPTMMPQVNEPLANAQVELGKLYQSLPVPEDNWPQEAVDQYQLLVGQELQRISQQYGVPVESITQPAPQMPDRQATEAGYFMQGPNGQPVRVGGMIDPQQRILDYINNPRMIEEAMRQRAFQQQNFENQSRLGQNAAYQLQTRINLNNSGASGAGGGATPDY